MFIDDPALANRPGVKDALKALPIEAVRLRPLHDRVLILRDAPPETTVGGILLPPPPPPKSNTGFTGIVIAIGNGDPDGDPHRRTPPCAVGDRVTYPAGEARRMIGYGFGKIGERLDMVRFWDVLSAEES